MMHQKALTTAALLVVISTLPARAQTMVDMSLISCDQFLKSPSERKAVLSSWMGGYFSSQKNLATIDARYVTRNSQKVSQYCGKARKETLMSAIQRTWR
jgi:acid stress chaperone HdeB